MSDNTLEKYAYHKLQIKEHEALAAKLLPKVLEVLEDEEKVDIDEGHFSLVKRKKWAYSPNIDSLSDQLKIAKIEEEEQGIAQCEIINSVTFKPKK